MSTDEDNINTSSIEEMINANLGIDPNEQAETASSEAPLEESAVEVLTEANTIVTDSTTEEVLKSIDIDALLNDASDDDTAESIAEEVASEAQDSPEIEATEGIAQESENTASSEIIAEESPADNSEVDTSTEEGNAEITAEPSQDAALDNLLSSAMEEEPAPASTDTEPAIEAIIEPVAKSEEQVTDDQAEIDAEETTNEVQEIPEEEPTEGLAAENENTAPEQAAEIADNTDTHTPEETEAVKLESEASEPVDNALPGAEAIQSLETEVAELDSEIQTQIDQFAIQADHLKANIQGELQRVCSDNEQLHEQIKELEQQLLSAEDKIQGFTEIQDQQQVTIHKLILIVKGIRSKISHLYDE